MGNFIRDPKGLAQKGKYEAPAEDIEDFEQEKLIQEWLEREGADVEFEFKHINRKGNARNTLDTRSLRLDAQMRDESGSGTFADIIAGSDGRDLECGPEPEPPTAEERYEAEVNLFFDAIGASEGTKQWAKKLLKSEQTLKSLRSLMKDDEQLQISPINLEWPRRWGNFRK